jgi:hypothetical protein
MTSDITLPKELTDHVIFDISNAPRELTEQIAMQFTNQLDILFGTILEDKINLFKYNIKTKLWEKSNKEVLKFEETEYCPSNRTKGGGMIVIKFRQREGNYALRFSNFPRFAVLPKVRMPDMPGGIYFEQGTCAQPPEMCSFLIQDKIAYIQADSENN